MDSVHGGSRPPTSPSHEASNPSECPDSPPPAGGPEASARRTRARQTARSLLREALAGGWTMEALERAYILTTLARVDGRKSDAVRILGISRRTLYRKLAKYRDEGFLSGDDCED